MAAISSHLINKASAALERAGVDSPRLSARMIMGFVLGCSQEKVLTYPDLALENNQVSMFESLVRRRAEGEPLAYITGSKEFYGYDFLVDKSVLIPRPETELIVELAVEHFKSSPDQYFADIGTGCGAIAVSLALEIRGSLGLACDISLPSLLLARRNALIQGVQDRVFFFRSDLGMGIRPGTLDFVVSNPPYLSIQDMARTSLEVSAYEPFHALVSPDNGLQHIKRLQSVAWLMLKDQGMIFLEMGNDQSHEVEKTFSKWKKVRIHKDLAGYDRALSAVKS